MIDHSLTPSLGKTWHDPRALLTAEDYKKFEAQRPKPPAPPPVPNGVSLSRQGGTLHVRYDASSAAAVQPARLVVTVNSPSDPLPPTHRAVDIRRHAGVVDTGIRARANWRYDASVSIAGQEALASGAVPVSVPPG